MDKLLEEYKNYNLDEDPSKGVEGRNLAERVYKKYGRFDIRKIIEEQAQWDVWKKIAFRKFPPLLSGETILVREIKERLGELKRAKYDVKPGYSALKKKDTWNCLRQIRKDITIHLRENNL